MIDLGYLIKFFTVVIVGVLVCVCVVAGVAGIGDMSDNFLDDRADVHTERMREFEIERQRQEVLEAQEETEQAKINLDIARADAGKEKAKEGQLKYQVEWERAAGDRAIDEANAEIIRLLGLAGYKAIQRQGRLLSLSVVQQYFFGGVMGVALVAVVVLTLMVLNTRKITSQETDHESQ